MFWFEEIHPLNTTNHQLANDQDIPIMFDLRVEESRRFVNVTSYHLTISFFMNMPTDPTACIALD